MVFELRPESRNCQKSAGRRTFLWKQQDDKVNNIPIYPFENAEARFAIGVFQALGENDSEAELQKWITEVLQALGEAKQTNEDIAKSYKLDQSQSHIEQAQAIPSNTEKRLYLSSCWLESLCTAEARFLGWVYQELYGKPFQPWEFRIQDSGFQS
jgi:predicted ATPase